MIEITTAAIDVTKEMIEFETDHRAGAIVNVLVDYGLITIDRENHAILVGRVVMEELSGLQEEDEKEVSKMETTTAIITHLTLNHHSVPLDWRLMHSS